MQMCPLEELDQSDPFGGEFKLNQETAAPNVTLNNSALERRKVLELQG